MFLINKAILYVLLVCLILKYLKKIEEVFCIEKENSNQNCLFFQGNK